MKLPYIKFWPRDWMGETALQCLNYDARGLWIELICLMATSDQYGYLVFGGKPMTTAEIARITRGNKDEVERLLELLLKQNVCSRCPQTKAIFSRRMVKEADLHDKRAESGKKGANAHWHLSPSDSPSSVHSHNHSHSQCHSPQFATPDSSIFAKANAKAKAEHNPPTLEECVAFADQIGLTRTQVEEFHAYYDSQGWLKGNGQPITNIRSALTNWKIRDQKYQHKEAAKSGKVDTRKSRFT